MAEKMGHVVAFKHNRQKLLVIDLDTEPQIEMTEDEKLQFVAERILREHRAAFEELAISKEKTFCHKNPTVLMQINHQIFRE